MSVGMLGALFTVMAVAAQAQTPWPEKPIRFIVPFTPGGGTDTVSRHLAEKITQDTQWSFLIDNKPGAGGNIGMDLVAKAKPDGLTLGMGQTSNLAINPSAMAKMPFDAQKDFVPVALVAEIPMVLVVRTDSAWKNLDDLIRSARAKPESVKQALAGTGTVGHLAGEMLSKKANFKVLSVPYKGAAPAVTDKIDEWDAENAYDENEAEFGKESELFGPSTFEDDFIKSSDAGVCMYVCSVFTCWACQ
jgi:tripartite-type tricarboxylate transporter receptor subunit TctC